ncbi:MAG: SRPBCC domain-containing protein [Bryobacterales bacterium]|nr:SRPBCC domain-containing protein [Bryobacterales bacterium]
MQKRLQPPSATMDVRPSAASIITMRSPDGVGMPNPGVFLEAVPIANSSSPAPAPPPGNPPPKSFLTIVLTFEEEAGKTRYAAPARV